MSSNFYIFIFFIYVVCFFLSFYVIWHFDIKKFLVSKQQWLAYLIMFFLSAGLAFVVGSFFSVIAFILQFIIGF